MWCGRLTWIKNSYGCKITMSLLLQLGKLVICSGTTLITIVIAAFSHLSIFIFFLTPLLWDVAQELLNYLMFIFAFQDIYRNFFLHFLFLRESETLLQLRTWAPMQRKYFPLPNHHGRSGGLRNIYIYCHSDIPFWLVPVICACMNKWKKFPWQGIKTEMTAK